LVPSYGCSSLELVCGKHDILLLEDVSHVEELLHFVNPVKEGPISRFLLKEKILIFILYSLGVEYFLLLS